VKGQEEDIFFGHLLPPKHFVPVERISEEQYWPSFLLVICLVILALIKVRAYPKTLRIIQSTFSGQILQQLEREERNPFKFYSIALNIFFVLNLAFLCYKINVLNEYVLVENSRFLQYCFFLGIILLVLLIKALVNRLLAIFTDAQGLFSDFMISAGLLNQTFGLFIFPCIILMEFSDFDPRIFITIALLILGFSVLLRWYRGVKMGLIEERIGLLQIFSYFCGLEILPVLVTVKYLIETF
jgi:hypothetical protein